MPAGYDSSGGLFLFGGAGVARGAGRPLIVNESLA